MIKRTITDAWGPPPPPPLSSKQFLTQKNPFFPKTFLIPVIYAKRWKQYQNQNSQLFFCSDTDVASYNTMLYKNIVLQHKTNSFNDWNQNP